MVKNILIALLCAGFGVLSCKSDEPVKEPDPEPIEQEVTLIMKAGPQSIVEHAAFFIEGTNPVEIHSYFDLDIVDELSGKLLSGNYNRVTSKPFSMKVHSDNIRQIGSIGYNGAVRMAAIDTAKPVVEIFTYKDTLLTERDYLTIFNTSKNNQSYRNKVKHIIIKFPGEVKGIEFNQSRSVETVFKSAENVFKRTNGEPNWFEITPLGQQQKVELSNMHYQAPVIPE